MKYANTRVTIRDKDHLDLVAAKTGMKMHDHVTNNMYEMLGSNLTIVFEEDFDSDNDCWGYDHHILEEDSLRFREIFIEDEPELEPPFKIRNADSPAVRKWLKGQGYDTLSDGYSIDLLNPSVDSIIVMENGIIGWWSVTPREEIFENHPAPELILNIEPVVMSWELVDKQKIERQERIKELESELQKLKEEEGQ